MSLPYLNSFGSPVNYPHSSQRVPFATGPRLSGPLIFQDFHLIDNLAHLGRERIPERIVHAKGCGAHGTFKVTTPFASTITSQTIFQTANLNREIPLTVRFSTVAGELGSADTDRDTHGFAVKLKTGEGNWDWVFLDTPTFFISDPAKYPNLVHATKRNPQSNLKDPDMFWDFFSQNPESIHQLLMIFSDRGTPNGFQNMNGAGVQTFVFVKNDDQGNDFHYVKFHLKPVNGVKTLNSQMATQLAGTDPDYDTRLLFNAIKDGNFPKWDVFIQVMSRDQAANNKPILFDVTKTWPQGTFPLNKIGELVLNKNPDNFFDEIEQIGFAPAHLIPYIEASPDLIFMARLFIYPDTQRYRIGVNNQQLPINRPLDTVTVANHQRAGAASIVSQGSRPNYQSTVGSLNFVGPRYAIDSQIRNSMRHEIFNGSADRDQLIPSDYVDGDFVQPRALWDLWTPDEKTALVNNVAESLGQVTRNDIKYNQLLVFNVVKTEIATRIANAIHFTFNPPPNALQALINNLKVIKKDILPNGPQ